MDLYCVLISFVELCNLLFSEDIIAGVDPTDQKKDKIDLLYKSHLAFTKSTAALSRGYKTFFMLNSTEAKHEIFPAHKC